MKKYCIIAASTLAFCVTSNAATESKTPITIGVEYHVKSTEALPAEWSNIVKAVQSATHQPVQIKEYCSYRKIAQDLASGKLTLGYLKSMTGNTMITNNKDIQLLGSAVTKNPMTGKVSTMYDAEILVAKDSVIHNLADLQNKTFAYYSMRSMSNYVSAKEKLNAQHIHVHWKKCANESATFNAVLQHHADAVSAWDYLIFSNSNKHQFRVISTTHGLKNPGMYVNNHVVSAAEQQKISMALTHVKGPYGIVGFRQ